MRILIQRVTSASVSVEGELVGAVGRGLAILVGVGTDDTERDADHLAQKTLALRIFNDEAGKMNLSPLDVAAEFLVVSQFTLYADTSRGRRPSFIYAAPPEVGERLYLRYVEKLRSSGHVVNTGRFGAEMLVQINNDGPVTIMLQTDPAS